MKKTCPWAPVVTTLVLSLAASTAGAKVSEAEAAKLGKELTCVGAEVAGNKDGTIPAFSGKWLGTPPGIKYTLKVGQHPLDAYPDDKPLFTITAANVAKYADHLSDGQKAMFARYPETFRMPVYTSRRDFRYPDAVCEISKKNAVQAELIDDGLGFTGLMGSSPFPIPKLAMEVLANMNFPYRAFNEGTLQRDIADVSPKGDISWGRQFNFNLNVVTHPDNVGKPIQGVMAYARTGALLPERDKGTITVSQEPVNFAQGKRLAWNYDPGTRRVRQLPVYGFDNPLAGTSGKMTIDQDRLMNGDPSRYEWILHGKREMYIPANTYRVHSKDVKYADLLKPGHANPDFMRYELRRVWVLEGKLKEGFRHLFGKRVMFIDEDNWQASVGDYYDTRGQLWQHAFINHYYAYDMNAWQAGSAFYHDLNSGGYVGYNLWQERERGPVLNKGDLNPDQYTPAALRAAGN
ncbi:DUF1329 domain-containing protein [Aromatoleum anaerobium]|uniref:DUF1329 domain-containing protein n=1 Tax=Aromatoleum anaerobium TaxID=182180 RepID=A0ABX1PM72_9RHOO|nr:DUF1329 domain-containing protein [Aromatoleum anaerobium]MCK0508011.1 DUF1329 domain-containing protein [Aromatoleum anaerobium]